MSGHSKWKTIKHQKGVADAKRSQAFTRLTKEIIVAAKEGGGDSEMNPRLRLAIERARVQNMPNDNIDRAIKRATGADSGDVELEELTYEGYGPGGVAILVSVVTDNRNRSVSQVRSVFEHQGGKMGQTGSVNWLFEQKGVLSTDERDEERAQEVALLAIDLGAEDFELDGSYLEARCAPEQFEDLRGALEARGVIFSNAELDMSPKSTVRIDEKTAEQTLRLLDRLEDLDDVQKVFSNADFPDEVLDRLSSAV